MIKIIPRDLIKHLERGHGQATAPIVEPVNPNTNFPNLPDASFIFRYDGEHKDFFQELISKANAVYSGTNAKIQTGTSGEIPGNLIRRMGLISTIANNSNLRSYNLWPITATQSEYLLQAGKLTNLRDNCEDLALLLYDTNGNNPKEAQALKEGIIQHRDDLGLSQSDLEKRLVVVNAGGKVDSNMPHGVKPIIIPGITQVYAHETLNKTGKDHNFEYGLNRGIPAISELGKGKRTLYMPSKDSNIGLRVLYRYWDLDLSAGDRDLASSGSDGRINFAHQKFL